MIYCSDAALFYFIYTCSQTFSSIILDKSSIDLSFHPHGCNRDTRSTLSEPFAKPRLNVYTAETLVYSAEIVPCWHDFSESFPPT